MKSRLPVFLLTCALALTGLGRPLVAQTTYTPYQFVTLAGKAGNLAHADGTGAGAEFITPRGVVVDSSGNLYIADRTDNTIREVTPGGVVTTIAGSPGVSGIADGAGSAARFNAPCGIAMDRTGNLYVAENQNDVLREITPTASGGITTWTVSTLRNTATAPYVGYFFPVGVAVDGAGDLFYTEVLNLNPTSSVWELAAGSSAAQSVAGHVISSPGSEDGIGPNANFTSLSGLAIDAGGILYTADYAANNIRKITPTANGSFTQLVVTTLAGTATIIGSADGTGGAAQFSQPTGVAVDSKGDVYVADSGNNTIRRITPAGVVTTVGGVPGVAGSSDGTGALAHFNGPTGVAVDANGNLYVTDTGNGTIREGFVPAVPPAFTLNASPATGVVATGRSAVFNAIANGTPAPTYQWTFNGSTTIPGAATTADAILVVTSATPANTGTYTCTATNSAGSASSSATLTVTASSNPGYLTNLSGRGVVGLGLGNGLFAGFGISGTGSKQLLIRGIGPGLLVPYPAFVGYLPDPSLTLYDNTPAVIATNDNWGGGSTLVNAQLAVGAYALPSNSLDAMLYFPEPASSYSAEVSGNNSTTGISVVELYDADTASPPPAKLINVSVRAPVGTGGNILFGGFTIGGATSETVLIRAIGPGFPLSFGLGGVALQQPVLTLFAGITPIYSNTVWGGDPALATAMAEVGAYPLAANTQDSLLLVTLPPGGYSAEISGVNNTTGVAAVEVYEIP